MAKEDAMATSVAVTGKRGRPAEDVEGNSDKSPGKWGPPCRVRDLHSALVAEKGKVKEHAQWWTPDLESRSGAARASEVAA